VKVEAQTSTFALYDSSFPTAKDIPSLKDIEANKDAL
jgi:hypothetical protein